jgi:outer membrane murein-binding lipoprotein Lpp
MRGLSRSIGAIAVAGAVVGGCASSPKKIDAAYVSPLKYQSFTCDQLAIERTAIEYRANRLHAR